MKKFEAYLLCKWFLKVFVKLLGSCSNKSFEENIEKNMLFCCWFICACPGLSWTINRRIWHNAWKLSSGFRKMSRGSRLWCYLGFRYFCHSFIQETPNRILFAGLPPLSSQNIQFIFRRALLFLVPSRVCFEYAWLCSLMG